MKFKPSVLSTLQRLGFRLSRNLAPLIVLLCLIATPAFAATFASKTFAQLVGEAEQIFVGTVSSLQSRKLSNGVIVTDIRFSNLQVIKGGTSDAEIVLLVLGGEVDGLRLETPGVPQLQLSSRYLVFSKGNGKDMFPVVGGPAGIFLIAGEAQRAISIVLDSSGKELANDVVADVLSNVSSREQLAFQPPVTLELLLTAIKARLGQQ